MRFCRTPCYCFSTVEHESCIIYTYRNKTLLNECVNVHTRLTLSSLATRSNIS